MIIDTFGDSGAITVHVKKNGERNGVYVTLAVVYPECNDCKRSGDECEYCVPGKDLVAKPFYCLTVQYDGMGQTTDEFDSFFDAFDSFSNIVKTLTKQEDV